MSKRWESGETGRLSIIEHSFTLTFAPVDNLLAGFSRKCTFSICGRESENASNLVTYVGIRTCTQKQNRISRVSLHSFYFVLFYFICRGKWAPKLAWYFKSLLDTFFFFRKYNSNLMTLEGIEQWKGRMVIYSTPAGSGT